MIWFWARKGVVGVGGEAGQPEQKKGAFVNSYIYMNIYIYVYIYIYHMYGFGRNMKI